MGCPWWRLLWRGIYARPELSRQGYFAILRSSSHRAAKGETLASQTGV